MSTKLFSLVILYGCFPGSSRATQADDPFALAETCNFENLKSDKNLQFPILKEDRKGTGVRIVVEKISRTQVTLRLLNDSKETVYVAGYGLKSPFYEPEIFSDHRWVIDPNHMNCGTGAYLAPLAAGKWFRFEVPIPKGSSLVRFRIQFDGARDQAGNRQTTSLCTEPIHLTDEQAVPAPPIVDPFANPVPPNAKQPDGVQPDTKPADKVPTED